MVPFRLLKGISKMAYGEGGPALVICFTALQPIDVKSSKIIAFTD